MVASGRYDGGPLLFLSTQNPFLPSGDRILLSFKGPPVPLLVQKKWVGLVPLPGPGNEHGMQLCLSEIAMSLATLMHL